MNKSSKKFDIQTNNFIKDRVIVNFILSHSQKPSIDFFKIKIPSFLDIIDTIVEEENCIYKEQIFKRNKINMEENEKVWEYISFPTFEFSTLKDQNFEFIHSIVFFFHFFGIYTEK